MSEIIENKDLERADEVLKKMLRTPPDPVKPNKDKKNKQKGPRKSACE